MEKTADFIEYNDLSEISYNSYKNRFDSVSTFENATNDSAATNSLQSIRNQFLVAHGFDTQILPRLQQIQPF